MHVAIDNPHTSNSWEFEQELIKGLSIVGANKKDKNYESRYESAQATVEI